MNACHMAIDIELKRFNNNIFATCVSLFFSNSETVGLSVLIHLIIICFLF